MRLVQVGVFMVGLASFAAAVFFIGHQMGGILWRVGTAVMLVDIVLIKLWPSSKS